jgi:hypothetical protein
MDIWTQKKVIALRIERDAAAKSGNHFDALVINDRIRNLKGTIYASVNDCPSCGRQFTDGETCSRGGCPMGGDV